MNKEIEKLIKEEANRIRASLIEDGQVGNLYGEPLDIHNSDAVLVAAVSKAHQDELEKQIRLMRII